MNRTSILGDPDVRRSATYLVVSLAVSGIKAAVQRYRDRNNSVM